MMSGTVTNTAKGALLGTRSRREQFRATSAVATAGEVDTKGVRADHQRATTGEWAQAEHQHAAAGEGVRTEHQRATTGEGARAEHQRTTACEG